MFHPCISSNVKHSDESKGIYQQSCAVATSEENIQATHISQLLWWEEFMQLYNAGWRLYLAY